ncbi:MAG: DUF3048 domain-containing protein, partial [Chloroflexi bacterium]
MLAWIRRGLGLTFSGLLLAGLALTAGGMRDGMPFLALATPTATATSTLTPTPTPSPIPTATSTP